MRGLDFHELVAGLIALTAVMGTVVIAVGGRPVAPEVTAIAGAAIGYFFGRTGPSNIEQTAKRVDALESKVDDGRTS